MVNVLFATSEAVPFIKTGGLADVCGSLPKYFDRKLFDVRVILPKYLCIGEEIKKTAKYRFHFYIDLSWRKQYVGIFEAVWQGITYYLVDSEYYFGGDRPYHMIHEDVEKFAFFSKAVIEAIPLLNFLPDVIHCHDWQTALIPVFLKTQYRDNPMYRNIKTVFTIHNLKFQGCWNLKAIRDITGLPDHAFTSDKLEFYGEANYLKGGIVYADRVTTVSENYAREITTPEGGEGLDGLLRSVEYKLSGIVNGLDFEEYDPEKDRLIAYNFSKENRKTGKCNNKQELQERMGLERKNGVFLAGIVSRLTSQKGMDLLAEIMETLLSRGNIQIVALGTGEERYENMLRYFADRFPGRMSCHIGYSEEAAHRIYASCDAFLMPSLFEPCGLSQLMSMRYGTVPIVRETGGLKDTVEPYNEFEGTGTGFSFANFSSKELLNAVRYAMRVYYNHPEEWMMLTGRCMDSAFSWEESARSYEELYMGLL